VKSVAQFQANKTGEGGTILKKQFKLSELTPSPDRYREAEVLVKGVVTGATPQPAPSGGTKTAF